MKLGNLHIIQSISNLLYSIDSDSLLSWLNDYKKRLNIIDKLMNDNYPILSSIRYDK